MSITFLQKSDILFAAATAPPAKIFSSFLKTDNILSLAGLPKVFVYTYLSIMVSPISKTFFFLFFLLAM